MPRRSVPIKKNNTNKIIILSVIAAIVLVIGLVLLNARTSTSRATTAIASATRDWGSPNAPITVVEYADLQCPVCARSVITWHQLASQYIDTGKVRIVYRHFAFIGQESEWAGQAAECANDQNKFWTFVDYIFAHQAGENQGTFSRNNLKQFANALGLDMQNFGACFDSNKYANLVKQQTVEGQTRGIRATPSFFINDQFIEGLLSKDQFTDLFETLLKR